MNGIVEAFVGSPSVVEEPVATEVAPVRTGSLTGPSLHDEQIRSLVQHLFFRPSEPEYRHVAFTTADPQTEIARMCLSIARVLCGHGRHNIAVIDASLEATPLNLRMGTSGARGDGTWELETRLWLVSREEWLEDDPAGAVSSESLIRLQAVSKQFDFSLLCCDPMSSLPARIGRVSDGLVLVLTASKTRRLAAVKIRQQLRAAGVPLLGTVLASRPFPVPAALYRKL